MLEWSISENTTSTYIRLTSLPVVINFSLPESYAPEIGKGVKILSGEDAIIFSYGPQMLTNAVTVAKNIKESLGLEIGVVNFPWLNTIDQEWLKGVIDATKHIFCIDNHYSIGALSDRIASIISSDPSLQVCLKTIALDEIPACGTNDEILSFHGLDIESIEKVIKNTLI